MAKKAAEFRESSTAELGKRVVEMKAELSKEKSLVASGTRPEKPAKIRTLRRDIARSLTIIKEHEMNKQLKEKKDKKGIKEGVKN